MTAKYVPLIVALLTAAVTTATTAANTVQYTAKNTAAATPGGSRYDNEIGDDYTLRILPAATDFVWRTFQQLDDTTLRKPVQEVSLSVDDIDGVAYTVNGDKIHVSARYLAGYAGPNGLKVEFTGIIVHEMTHVWQWFGNGQAPSWLVEGVADYVRLRAGYPASNWAAPGQGDRWDQGYSVTARFLEYCEAVRGGFVAELNKKMRDGYGLGFFQDLTGKSVDLLWSDYKAKYGN